MDLLAHKYSYRKSVRKTLSNRLSRNAEVAVYLRGNKNARSWYGFWQCVVVEAMLGGSSLKTEVSIMPAKSNGFGGTDVTGAAHRSIATVKKILVELGVTPTSIVDCGVIEE